jgi:L-fuconolactonase
VCTLAATYAQVVETAADLAEPLSAHERAAVFADNAARTYDLRVGPTATA